MSFTGFQGHIKKHKHYPLPKECGLGDIMDSTSDSILAFKLTKDTVTLHNKVSNVCAPIAGQIVSEVGYLAHEQMLACI